MLLCNKNTISSLNSSDLITLKYFPVPIEEEWRIGLIQELIDTRLSHTDISGFTSEEISDLLNIACAL